MASGCLGEANAVANGLTDVGVVEEPAAGGGGKGLGMSSSNPAGVQVRGDGDGAFLEGGIN